MKAIGKRGFASLVASKFQGDRAGAMDWLRGRAHEKRLESFVDAEMDRRLAGGERTVCVELPCISGPDEEPW